jgi:hypothetical protein
MGSMVPTDVPSARRFAAWAVAPWILLLLAALGCLQYLQHGEYVYLAAALLVFMVCAAGILRLSWARNSMRVMAMLLSLWAMATAILMLRQWGDFDVARQHVMTQPQSGELALWLIARAQRTWQVGLALKVVAIPLLWWLAWQLGRPAVHAQFKPPR